MHFWNRVERITASGGEVGRLHIVGGAEVHLDLFRKNCSMGKIVWRLVVEAENVGVNG